MHVEAYWFEDEVWQGFLPIESRSVLLERHVFQTYVAGLRGTSRTPGMIRPSAPEATFH
jgi:hypothetical protein